MKTGLVDLGYGIMLALITAAILAGAALTLYSEQDSTTGHVVVACALYLGFLAAALIRRGIRKL